MMAILLLIVCSALSITTALPKAGDIIPDEFIVKMKIEVERTSIGTAHRSKRSISESEFDIIVKLKKRYHDLEVVEPLQVGRNAALLVHGKIADIREAVAVDGNIEYIEENRIIRMVEECVTQSTGWDMWGLDRIDQEGPVNLWYADGTYIHRPPTTNGVGVDAYIVDTGIDITHPDFGGRAVWGFTAAGINDGDEDGKGHGTHVAGIVGSTTYGVSKDVNLIAVKVLDNSGSGSLATVLDGLNWVSQQHQTNTNNVVVNLSLGMPGESPSLEGDIRHMVMNEGIAVVVAAGNDGTDACGFTPAKSEDAITVGASDVYDDRAWFSNVGECVNVAAPGDYILSTYKYHGVEFLSGTSMAAPHVTGAIVHYLKTTTFPVDRNGIFDWLDSAKRYSSYGDQFLLYHPCQ